MEFFRTLFVAVEAAPVLSLLPFLGRDDGVAVMCSFCWCLRRRSRRAKQRAQSGHSKGFSFVWERSWRFKCSSRAKDRPQVVQTWGRGLSDLGGGAFAFDDAFWLFESDCLESSPSPEAADILVNETAQCNLNSQDLPVMSPGISLMDVRSSVLGLMAES